MATAVEATFGRAVCANGDDTPEVVTRARLDEAMQQLWEKVETELRIFRIALQSAGVEGVDIEAMAESASRCPTSSITSGPPKEVASVNVRSIDIGSNPDAGDHPEAAPNLPITAEASIQPNLSKPFESSATTMMVREHVLKEHGLYQWNSTLWDVCTFVGTPALGKGGSLLIGSLTLVAILVQFTYVFVIEDLLVPNTFDSKLVEGLRKWRVVIAHDARYLDESSWSSLASRVCNLGNELEMSTIQQGYAHVFNNFLVKDLEVGLAGPEVSLMAIGSFITVVLIELRQSISWVASLYQLVTPSHTFISLDPAAAKQLKLHSISRARFVCILLLALTRISIAVSLGWVATRYLSYTTSVTTLFLMAVKFAFVLNIDELLFRSCSSHVIKVMISQVANISAPYRLRVHMGCDRASILCIAILIGVLLLAKLSIIDDVADRLRLLQDTVCGGNKQFVFAHNPTYGIIEWATLENRQPNNSYLQAAISELQTSDLSSDGFKPTLSRRASFDRVKKLRMVTRGNKHAEVFTTCVDRLDRSNTEGNTYLMSQAILSARLGYEVASCQDINQTVCDETFHIETRAHCPVYCGCGDWTSGLFLNGEEYGCNADCFREVRVKEHMRSTKCVDMTKAQLHIDSAWIRYWNAFAQHLHVSTEYDTEYDDHQVAKVALEQEGCAVIQILEGWGDNFCEGYLDGSPLTAFCPETCGCTDNTRYSRSKYCPPSCEDAMTSQSSGQ